MSLTRRSRSLALAAAPFAGPALAQTALAPADQALVDRAVAYLEGLTEAEAKFVAAEIRVLAKEGMRHGDIAVLYRSNLQARPVEEEPCMSQQNVTVMNRSELIAFEHTEMQVDNENRGPFLGLPLDH